MTPGDEMQFNEAAKIASIEERVTGLEKGLRDVVDAIRTLSSELRQNGKTQWPAIISGCTLAVTIVTTIGLLAYWPIQQKQADLDRSLEKVILNMMTQREANLIRDYAEKADIKHDRRLERMEEFVFKNFPPSTK